MAENQLATQLDATWGNPDDWVANGLQWSHLGEVQSAGNLRVSGDPSIGRMEWLVRQTGGALPLGRVLVLGCGSGRVERELHLQGWAREIVAFDLSPKVLAVAQAATTGMGIEHVVASMNDIPVGQAPFLEGSFDAVFGISSVHHCADLENLYAAVARLLTPNGWFLLDEYVGPDQFQFSDALIQQLSAVAELLPDRMLTTLSGVVRRGFRSPTVAEVVAVDPSEAIHASDILPLLQERFDIVARRPYGGTLLHLLLADVAQNFMPADAKPWLQALIDAEDDLDRLGRLEQHFSCAVARPRRATIGTPTPDR